MNQRTLSSAQTPWVKIVAVLIHAAFGCFALGIWLGVLHPHQAIAPLEWLEFVGFWLLLAWFTYSIGYFRVKRVRVDNDAIYLSNYLKEVRLPLAAIEQVIDRRGLYLHLIAVSFRAPTPFGGQIVFMPKMHLFDGSCPMFWGRKTHGVVGELKELIAVAAQRGG